MEEGKTKVLISAIVPVYNTDKYLDKCITSILNQTYKELEIILIDDGSQDMSGEICKKYKEEDTRVILIHKKNEGVSAARNLGINTARGDWITFVDSDDWIEENAYEVLIELAKKTNADMIASTTYYQNENALKTIGFSNNASIHSVNEAAMLLLKFKFPSSLCMCMYSASMIKETYLNDKIHYWEDLEYQYRVLNRDANKSAVIAINHRPFYHYREGSITHSILCEKKVSCLSVTKLLKLSLSDSNEEINSLINKMEISFIIDLANLGAKDRKHDKKCDLIIRRSARKLLPFVWSNESYKFTKKVYLLILTISINLYYFLFRLKYRK